MSQRHATDVVALVFGTIFAGSAIVWLVDLDGHLDRHNSWWVGPLVLVAAGVAGLVAALRPERDHDHEYDHDLDLDDRAGLEDEPAG
jgi:hypothetical protein